MGMGGSDAPLEGVARCPCLISVAVIRSATEDAEDALEKVVCCDELGVWEQRTKTGFRGENETINNVGDMEEGELEDGKP